MKKQTTRNAQILNLVLSAMFLAIGLVLPFLTGQIRQFGNMLLPMHLPVLLCGLICGWQYGGAVGAILPFLRYTLFGMPQPFPTGAAMTFELAAYGIIAGLLYARARRQSAAALYSALISAMIGGRVVWGLVRALISGAGGAAFTWQLFFSEGFLTAIPGIILQLVLIPALMVALDRTGLVPFQGREAPVQAGI